MVLSEIKIKNKGCVNRFYSGNCKSEVFAIHILEQLMCFTEEKNCDVALNFTET